MKYTNSIMIDLPREEVARLLSDPAHIPAWLRGVVSHEPLDGEHGQVGTTSRIVMQAGSSTMELTETVTRREPADLQQIPEGTIVQFDRETVGAGMRSIVRDRLTAIDPGRTLWVSDSEFRFDTLPMRLMGLFMPSAFRTQSQQHMQDFQEFAEQGTDVRESG